MKLTDQEKTYYQRHLALPTIGEAGQLKLKQARVLVVGAGGLGCPALQYLAAAGVGRIGIADGDMVEVSNLHRQVLFDFSDIGANKSLVAKEKLEKKNPYIEIQAFSEFISEKNIERLMREFDLIVDASDNFKTRYLLNDFSFFNKKILIHGSVSEFSGFVAVFRPGGACYRCLYPTSSVNTVRNCAEAGVLGLTPGLVGTYQAVETLKAILERGESPALSIDLLSGRVSRMALARDESCPLCGEDPTIAKLIAVEELEPGSLTDHVLVDIREFWNFEEEFTIRYPDKNGKYVLACNSGRRSLSAAESLQKLGYAQVYSLRGGLTSE